MIHSPARLLALGAAAALAVAACGAGSTAAPILPPSQAPTVAPASAAPASPAPGSAAPSAAPASQPAGGIPAGCPTSVPPPMAAGATATVTLTTEKGDIVIAVKGSLGPNAAGNFVALAKCGYFDGVIFHRLVPGFVIQGGDGQFGHKQSVDTRVGTGGPPYTFADDPVTVPYTRGTVAMANSGANTNGSQFFICLADLPTLPPSYSVFGTVTAGMDVVDAIGAMPNSGGQEGRALQPVAITKATVTTP